MIPNDQQSAPVGHVIPYDQQSAPVSHVIPYDQQSPDASILSSADAHTSFDTSLVNVTSIATFSQYCQV